MQTYSKALTCDPVMDAIRSGPLLKLTGMIIKDWKKKHCVLSKAGVFELYEKASDSAPSFTINMKTEVKDIVSGFALGSINLPSSRSDVEACFGVVTKGKTHYFLATTAGECRMWAGVLKTARTSTVAQGKKVAQAPPAFEAPPQPQSGFAPGYGGGHVGVQQGPYQYPQAGGYAAAVPVYEQQVNPQLVYPVHCQPRQQPMYGPGMVQGQQNMSSVHPSGERYMPGEQYMPGQQYMSGQYMSGQPHSP